MHERSRARGAVPVRGACRKPALQLPVPCSTACRVDGRWGCCPADDDAPRRGVLGALSEPGRAQSDGALATETALGADTTLGADTALGADAADGADGALGSGAGACGAGADTALATV